MKSLVKIGAFGLGTLGVMVSAASAADDTGLPDAPGKDVTLAICTQCHGADLFIDPRPADEWAMVVTMMIGNGMAVSDEEYQVVMDYLTTSMVPAADSAEPADQ